jgi:hypothetical protein
MQIVRVYDPERRPANWTDIIRPGQFVAFVKQLDTGAPCDSDGAPVSPDAVACLIFDALPEAAAFCRQRTESVPTLRFDIFDARGRTLPPLMTVVHPSRVPTLEGNPRAARFNRWVGIAMLGAAPFLFWLDWARYDGLLILPTILAINMVIIAARLLQLNAAYVSAERSRRERLAEYTDAGRF